MRARWWVSSLAAVALVSQLPTVWAQIVPALPFQLQNNTVADATQVMANFNQILNNVNTNSAKNGANSDITSLVGLTTPIAPGVGGTTTWTGGTSTGTANAQVVAAVVPSTFTLATGTRVVFKAGFQNTGAMTLNVAASGVKDVYRLTSVGPGPAVGGETITGQMVEVIYDGTQFQITGQYYLVGEVRDYAGAFAAGAPVGGWHVADGSCLSQTTYAALFTAIGAGYGSCGAGLFALPDLRGRLAVAKDNGTGRITGVCLAGNTLGTACGDQVNALVQSQLPNVNFTLAVSDTRTWGTSVAVLQSGGAGGPTAGAVTAAAPAATSVVVTGGSIGGTAASGGSGAQFSLLNPVLVVNKLIKL